MYVHTSELVYSISFVSNAVFFNKHGLRDQLEVPRNLIL
jgi:hypothetical protein